MNTFDIIPDIHGHADKLNKALANLGYRKGPNSWKHTDQQRQAVFLGDFIDRGPENGKVIETVRQMIDNGVARAIMGNHELKAIHFHSETEKPLRCHSPKNIEQHASFLAEFPLGDAHTREVLVWMETLPLFLEFGGFRAVHACWSEAGIRALKPHADLGVLNRDQLYCAANKNDPLYRPVDEALKGPEINLEGDMTFVDKGGHPRKSIRKKWWDANARTWRNIALSVPDPKEIPDRVVPEELLTDVYPVNAPPVFFGHYWMEGLPELQSKNALCLDYSAGKDGPLVSYTAVAGEQELSLSNLQVHQ